MLLTLCCKSLRRVSPRSLAIDSAGILLGSLRIPLLVVVVAALVEPAEAVVLDSFADLLLVFELVVLGLRRWLIDLESNGCPLVN